MSVAVPGDTAFAAGRIEETEKKAEERTASTARELHGRIGQVETKAEAELIPTFVQRVRAEEDLVKRPGIAETLDWAAALLALGEHEVRRNVVEQTLGFLIKDAQDLKSLRPARLDALLGTT